jgi:serine/threonine protein phosphatase PrpC
VKGQMGHKMEDYHEAKFQEVEENEVGLFAIFNGHSGHDVASYLRENLFDNILGEAYNIIIVLFISIYLPLIMNLHMMF